MADRNWINLICIKDTICGNNKTIYKDKLYKCVLQEPHRVTKKVLYTLYERSDRSNISWFIASVSIQFFEENFISEISLNEIDELFDKYFYEQN